MLSEFDLVKKYKEKQPVQKIVEEAKDINKTDVEVDIKGDEVDKIMDILSFLRESKYSEEDIIYCLNITKAPFNEFDALLKK